MDETKCPLCDIPLTDEVTGLKVTSVHDLERNLISCYGCFLNGPPLKCEKCGEVIEIGSWPFCPHGEAHSGVIGDEIPGGIEIRHGLCNEDGTPRRYYSKSEMAKEAKRRGLTNIVRHVAAPGTDKAPHTTKWV